MVKLVTVLERQQCIKCNGSGSLPNGQACPRCKGAGNIEVEVTR